MAESDPNPMATTAVQTSLTPRTPKLTAINNVTQFDPAVHLVGEIPDRKVSMKDLGFSQDIGVSPVAVSHPFQLFTHEAIEIMREEIFNVPDQYKFQSNIAAAQLRGYAPQYVEPLTYCKVLLT